MFQVRVRELIKECAAVNLISNVTVLEPNATSNWGKKKKRKEKKNLNGKKNTEYGVLYQKQRYYAAAGV